MKLSIIIPTLNEGPFIGRLLERVFTNAPQDTEIIVVDGGSTDTTLSILKCNKVTLLETEASRAIQMNAGAAVSTGDVLYFVHADTLPPESFYDDIRECIQKGKESGCYRFEFEEKRRWLLRINAFMTRMPVIYARGGDQSLFVKKELFVELGGYDESMVIMEEYPLIEKLMVRKTFKVMPKNIIVSARKYKNLSWRQVNVANYMAFKMYKKGKDTHKIKEVYERMLRPKTPTLQNF